MIMVCEMVGNYVLLPPLMFCSIVAFLLSRKLNLYQGQILDRFHSPAHHWDIQTDILRTMPIYHYKTYLHNSAVIKITQSIRKIKKQALERDEKDFIALDRKGNYIGIISTLQIMQLDEKTKVNLQDYVEKIPAITLRQNLGEALDLLLTNNLDKAAVIDDEKNFLGYIRYQEILELYFSKLRK